MGSNAVFEPVKPRFGIKINPGAAEPPRMTPERRRALEIAADGMVRAQERARGGSAMHLRRRPTASSRLAS